MSYTGPKARKRPGGLAKITYQAKGERALYELAVAAYVDGCQTPKLMSQRVPGLSQATARAFIDRGAPRFGLPPVPHTVEERVRLRSQELTAKEQAKVAAVVKAQEQEAAKLADDAVAQRARELKLVRLTREVGFQLGVVTHKLLQVGQVLARDLEAMVVDRPCAMCDLPRDAHAEGVRLPKGVAQHRYQDPLTPQKAVDLLRGVGTFAARFADVSRASVEMERLVAGEPTAILGHTRVPGPPMSDAEAEQWLNRLRRIASRERLAAPAEASGGQPVITVDSQDVREAPQEPIGDEEAGDPDHQDPLQHNAHPGGS